MRSKSFAPVVSIALWALPLGGLLATGCIQLPDTADVVIGTSDTFGGGGGGGSDTTVGGDATPVGCTSDEECQTDEPCQVGVCLDSGQCAVEVAEDGTPCEDGLECTKGDVCKAGECAPGEAVSECEEPCSSNEDCLDSEYCAAKTCEGPGECVERPEVCTEEYAPVCGCNDKDYGNACAAQAAGVRVAYAGVCECPAMGCPEQTQPVDINGDGCDDVCLGQCDKPCDCYGNDSIGLEGECLLECATCDNYWTCDSGFCIQQCGAVPPELEECAEPIGCKSNEQCGDGEYCAKADGACDSVGKCAPLPEACAQVYAPVCGCNGTTWGNGCEAAAAGINVAAPGSCESACGGFAGIACPGKNDVCDPPAGACNISDLMGVCVNVPPGCSKELAPVCGCDGKTYSNDCLRLQAGVQKDHDGGCGCDAILCQDGYVPTDQDGDGCDDSCTQCAPILCEQGFAPVDTNKDGCADGCVPTECTGNEQCPDGHYCKHEVCGGPGQCAAQPDGCPENWDPVCGCDGQTYGNACEAAANGQSVGSKGECAKKCGTIAGIPCPSGQWCEHPEDTCLYSDMQGTCVDVPQACPDLWAPVCGCDGNTYSNDCHRRSEQVQKAFDGQCTCDFAIDCAPGYQAVDEDGDGCADTCVAKKCETSADCDPSAAFGVVYCKKEGCGGGGTCAWGPDVCTKEYAPVCGCDGQTYDNACMASMAGVNVAAEGTCADTCKKGDGTCGDGFCETPTDTCFAKDIPGKCVDKPEACLAVYDPVCGCDHVTYGNDCMRQMAGVQKQSDGVCACASNDQCAADHYCSKEGCGPNESGQCVLKPNQCTLQFDPVCGCDGETYSNACFAAAAGAVVATKGACTDPNDECQSHADCADGHYCAVKDGQCGGPGVCQAKPQACDAVYDPVCACNGEQYGNACEAAAHGVNVAENGTCDKQCGGFIGLTCSEDQWCDLIPGACSGADLPGVCVTPEPCDKKWEPVCGCDGVTYPNDCARQVAKVQKDHDGGCDCPDLACEAGTTPQDTDGDGCFDSCLPCPQILCVAGSTPVDANNDGCADTCKPIECEHNEQCPDSTYCKKESCSGVGECAPKNEACSASEFAPSGPVCGCDGATWESACAASSAGVNVHHDGECKKQCGGFAGFPCDDGQFCEMEPGTCFFADDFGTCVEQPTICPDVWAPVCGCNGETYSNDCDRRAAGAQKSHDGACGCNIIIDCAPGYFAVDTDGDGCHDSCEPTQCESNKDCPESTFCKNDFGECGGGTCQPKPEVCPKNYAPVCSCQGETFGNECEAWAHGHNVAHDGVCSSACGNGVDCPDGNFCEFASGQCGVAGAAGSCVAPPKGCLNDAKQPVCGCDHVTYDSDCQRQQAGVSKAYDGPCTCGSNEECGAGYCATEVCGGPGTCHPKPEACTEQYDPVCGCDGETYGNACSAAAHGVTVASKGECGNEQGCMSDEDCAPSADGQITFCFTPAGGCGGPGHCEPQPFACPDVWAPVCTCTGETFGNECEAAANGQSVLHDGECGGDPDECMHNEECGSNGFCLTGQCGDVGQCETKPEACIEIYSPVCGCDGKTYDNECFAHAAGTSAASGGKCPDDVCHSNADCPDSGYCLKSQCNDSAGACVDKPNACPMVWAPVCSCANKTYGNSCLAQAAGANVAYEGECQTDNLCDANQPCPDGQFCAFADGCGGFGECADKPDACTQQYDPVCGCDGKTHGNACMAANAGVSIHYAGPCESAGCFSNDECFDPATGVNGGFCAFEFGQCGGPGQCVAKPDGCPENWAPVCGCDGKTYGNECEAQVHGQSVVHDGECKASCDSNDQCGTADGTSTGYCARPWGHCGGEGSCEPLPFGCPDVWAPVCGCDHVTYGNECEAASAGQSIAHEGECEVVGAECGSSMDCLPDEFCAKGQGDCGGTGQCHGKPDACTLQYDPVCGCDGQTYSNGCIAEMEGATVAYAGECQPDAAMCGNGVGCPDGQWCEFAAGSCGGEGICQTKPNGCFDVWMPVCGCNNTTYGNSCEAEAAGQSVAHEGECECKPPVCPQGSDAVDEDNDGCPDTCKYDCPIAIKCAAGYQAVDENGDGCANKCVPTCQSACDCYDTAGNDSWSNACPLLCANCGNFWSCGDDGLCQENCGVMSEESVACLQNTCSSNADCGDGTWCSKGDGDCDGFGECVAKPGPNDACPAIYDPVCGCDQETYGNGCQAASHGVNVASKGECGSIGPSDASPN